MLLAVLFIIYTGTGIIYHYIYILIDDNISWTKWSVVITRSINDLPYGGEIIGVVSHLICTSREFDPQDMYDGEYMQFECGRAMKGKYVQIHSHFYEFFSFYNVVVTALMQ